jgi:hypothetical protein
VSGAGHYAEAERLARAAAQDFLHGRDEQAWTRTGLAQVHAALALAAAIGLATDDDGTAGGAA